MPTTDRVAVFIDNSNVYNHLSDRRKVNPAMWTMCYDPLYLAQKLAGARQLVGTYFYCTPPPAHMLKDPVTKRKFENQTKYFSAVQKLASVEIRFGDLKGSGIDQQEKNLDTQLTADMITLAAQNTYDTAILVSNDSDYISAIKPVKGAFGKKIEILYFKGSISNSLWQLADVPRKARPSHFRFLPF